MRRASATRVPAPWPGGFRTGEDGQRKSGRPAFAGPVPDPGVFFHFSGRPVNQAESSSRAAHLERQLGLEEWRILDGAVARLFASPELEATIDAVADVFVPGFADGLVIALDDRRGDLRIGAVRGSAVAGDLAGAVVLPLRAEDGEIGRLHAIGIRGHGPLLDLLVERTAQALHNARRFEHERHVALTFQSAALAGDLPRTEGFRFEAIYEAGREEALVGGDWYDAFPLADGRIVVSIGDVQGSGLDAAIAMVNVRQTVRGVAQVHPDPALMLDAADRTLRGQHPDRFVTAFVGVLDPVTQRCSYANAGHPPPLLRLADGAIHAVRERGFPLGLPFAQQLDVHETPLPPNAILLLYTDGLTESTRDLLHGEARLDAVLREADPETTRNVAQHVYAGVLGGHANDDVAILAVRVGALPPLRRWRFDPRWSDAAARVADELRDASLRVGFPPARLVDLELVAAELIANAIRYAPGTVELILEHRAGRVVLHLLDKGPGYAVNPRLPSDLYSESGRGLFLVTQFSDGFAVERRPGRGSHARITFTTQQGASTA